MLGPLSDLNLDLAIVDVETTGWLPEQAELTEIGCVRLSGGQVTGEFATLIRPAASIPADITLLTGITNDMVSRAPSSGTALAAFLSFTSGCVLVAHNAPFDLGFLTAACTTSAIAWPQAAVIDTAVLARLVLSPAEVPDCRLATLAQYFGARTTPCHRALPDAKATADVLAGLLGLVAAARKRQGRRLMRVAS